MQEKDLIYKIPSYVSVAHFMHKTRPCSREPMQEWPVCYSDALFPVEGDICSLSALLCNGWGSVLVSHFKMLIGLLLAIVHLEKIILYTWKYLSQKKSLSGMQCGHNNGKNGSVATQRRLYCTCPFLAICFHIWLQLTYPFIHDECLIHSWGSCVL